MVFDSAKLQCKSSSLLPYLIDSFAFIISFVSNNPMFKIQIVWRFIFTLRRKNLIVLWGLLFYITATLFRVMGAKAPSGKAILKKSHFWDKSPNKFVFLISRFFELVHFSSCLGVWPFFSPEINNFQGVLKTTRHDATRHGPNRTDPTRPAGFPAQKFGSFLIGLPLLGPDPRPDPQPPK